MKVSCDQLEKMRQDLEHWSDHPNVPKDLQESARKAKAKVDEAMALRRQIERLEDAEKKARER